MTCPHLPAAVGPCGQGRQGGQGAGKDKGAQAAAAQHGAVAFGKAGEGVTALFQHGETPGAVGGARQRDRAPHGDGLRTGQTEDGNDESRPARDGGARTVKARHARDDRRRGTIPRARRRDKGKEANRHDRSLKRHPRRIKTLSALSLSRHHQKTRAFAASRGLVALFPGLYANATPLALYKDRSLKTKNAMGIFLVCIPGRAGEKTPFGDAYGAAPYFPRRDVAGLSHGERFIGHGRRRNGQSP